MTTTINIQNLSVIYPNNHQALTNVTLTFTAGHVYGLIGSNGSGKSTLFKSIMGLIPPTRGHVLINNQPIKTARSHNQIAYVPQTETVDWTFPINVYDVVMMGRYGHMSLFRRPKPTDHAAVATALAQVGMSQYTTRQIGELSGGQKKRVFVARALAQASPIILLDEPFTGVDVTTERILSQLFTDLIQDNRLLIVSTHNLGNVPDFCNDVVLINHEIIAAGPVKTTFTPDNLAQAFGSQLRLNHIVAGQIHHDSDNRAVTVLTDDEQAVVFYGHTDNQTIIKQPDTSQANTDD